MKDGWEEFDRKLGELEQVSVRGGVEEALNLVQKSAKGNCPRHDGELREGIFTQVGESGDTITGTCYTNKAYAMYVEFGTGPKGQADHKGISPNVDVAYTQKPWWIPEGSGTNEIDKDTADFYHMPSYTHHLDGYLAYEKTFRYSEGQAAHPFMYPALKDNEEEVTEIIKEGAAGQIRRILK